MLAIVVYRTPTPAIVLRAPGRFGCRQCPQTFDTLVDVVYHTRSHVNDVAVFHDFSIDYLRKVVAAHLQQSYPTSQRVYPCRYCYREQIQSDETCICERVYAQKLAAHRLSLPYEFHWEDTNTKRMYCESIICMLLSSQNSILRYRQSSLQCPFKGCTKFGLATDIAIHCATVHKHHCGECGLDYRTDHSLKRHYSHHHHSSKLLEHV